MLLIVAKLRRWRVGRLTPVDVLTRVKWRREGGLMTRLPNREVLLIIQILHDDERKRELDHSTISLWL